MQKRQSFSLLLSICLCVGSTADYVVVLGDSMAVGQGLFRNEDGYPEDPIGNPAVFEGNTYEFGNLGNFCWRDFSEIPGAFVAADRGKELVNLACAFTFVGGVVEQWEYAQARYDLTTADILVTIGANDAVSMSPDGSIYTIDNIIRCFGAILPWQTVNTDILDYGELDARLDGVFSKIAAEAPSTATVRVVGYPLQFRPYADLLCWSIVFPCARTFDALISRLNEAVEEAAINNGLEFVSIERDNPLPYAACSITDRHIRDLYIDSLIPLELGASSFHPIAQGNMEIAKRILASY